jgi:hypothetical protein
MARVMKFASRTVEIFSWKWAAMALAQKIRMK